MARDSRGDRGGYDRRDEYDQQRTPPRGQPQGQRAGNSRGGPPQRGGVTPPSRPTIGSNRGSGRGSAASDPRGQSGSGPRSARQEDVRRRSSQRDYGDSAQYSSQYSSQYSEYGQAPRGRDGRARQTVSRIARGLSEAVSRQFGAVARSAERAMRRGRGPEPRSEYRPAFAGGSLDELATEITPPVYRRSRIRLRAHKWRVQRTPPNPLKLFIILGSVAMLVVVVLGAGGAGMVYASNLYNQHLTQIQALAANLQGGQNSQILDRNGTPLYQVKDSNSNYNIYAPLAQMSPILRNATVDTEDPTFYSRLNFGIDLKSIVRAGAADAQAGGAAQGASTITQQLVKNIVLADRTKGVQRKVNEAVLAVGVTLNYTKDQILEMYLNSIDYGNQNTGIEAAARNFFGLTATPDGKGGLTLANQKLDIAQAAILAGLPNAPTYYNPTVFSCGDATCPQSKWANPCTNNPIDDGCTPSPTYCDVAAGCGTQDGHEWLVFRRARYVLQKMENYQHINHDQEQQAEQEVLSILQNHKIYVNAGRANGNVVDTTKNAPHFVDYVKDVVLPQQFGIDPDMLPHAGLKIYTTLDYNLDHYAETQLKYYIQGGSDGTFTNYWYCGGQQPPTGGCSRQGLAVTGNVHNGSVVAIDPHNGDILAMVGSVDYGSTDPHVLGFNNIATSNSRSMGSSTKALVYATAFQKGWYPGITLQDKTVCFPFPADDPQTNKPIITNKYAPACNGWYSPQNYEDFSFSGTAPIRPMLANSLNIPAAEAMDFVGDGAADTTSDAFLSMVQRLGITTYSKGRMGPATALGTQEIPLLQLTGAYATFADAGMRHPYRTILRIEDHDGNVLYQAPSTPQGEQVMSPESAYMLTSILTDNAARLPDFGWYNPLFFGNQYQYGKGTTLDYPSLQIAAKTGTSQGNSGPNDIVTMGYSPYLALGVWFGNTDPNDPLTPGIIGIAGAGYVFHDLMQWAISNYKWPTNAQFPIPSDMAKGQFNCTSGLAPYKGDKLAPCQLKPQDVGAVCPPYCATGLYLGLSLKPDGSQYAGGSDAPNTDWYIKGQAPGQS
jgi:membrane peptidoglycan carboxypeptidase